MSSPGSSVTTDGDSDPSVEIYAFDSEANALEEDPDEEVIEEEEEEEFEEEQLEEEEEEEEEEKEEEEEEEEVEEEQEEEQEEEVEQDMEGEDKGAVSGSPADVDMGGKDLRQHVESEGQKELLRPVSSVTENHEVMPPSSMHSMEENHTTLTMNKEDFQLKHEISSHPKSSKKLVAAEDVKSQGLDVDIEKAGSILQSKTFGRCSEPHCNSKDYLSSVKHMESETTKSSSDTRKDMEIGLQKRDCFVEDADVGQKSSNKTMHLGMEPGDDVKLMASRRTRSLSPSAERKDGNKRAAIICDFFAKGWCIRGSSCRFLHIKDPVNKSVQEAEGHLVAATQKGETESEGGIGDSDGRSRIAGTSVPFTTSIERTSLHSSEFPLKQSMQNGQEASPSWHASQDKKKHPLLSKENLSLENTSLPIGQDSFSLRDSMFRESRFALNASSNYFSTKLSSCSTRAEGMASIRNHHMYSGYKSKTTPYDWEPSVPFRPSFFITSMSISCTGDLYDPLRDSIEIHKIGDGSLKASLLIGSIQGSSQVRAYGHSAVARKNVCDLNDDKSSLSSHNRFDENEPNKNCFPPEKDCLATDTETTSGTYLNCQNGKMGMGQCTFGVEDNSKSEKECTEHDARLHGEGSGQNMNRVDRDKKYCEMDVDSQMDGSVHKEMKGVRNFRTILVDLVKELLRPSWREGRLSKDAHNLIVKKSADKVISTLEPHQIPATIDAAKHYVSSCRMKIAKLINGYVNKYGKS